MNEEEQQAWDLKMAQETLEHRKNVYDRYLDVLVEYNIVSTAYAAMMYQDLVFTNLQQLTAEQFASMLGTKEPEVLTEIQKVQVQIDHYDKLILRAEYRISGMTVPVKREIAKDSITHEVTLHEIWAAMKVK